MFQYAALDYDPQILLLVTSSSYSKHSKKTVVRSPTVSINYFCQYATYSTSIYIYLICLFFFKWLKGINVNKILYVYIWHHCISKLPSSLTSLKIWSLEINITIVNFGFWQLLKDYRYKFQVSHLSAKTWTTLFISNDHIVDFIW